MKTKIVGILVCTLLIIATCLSATGIMNINDNDSSDDNSYVASDIQSRYNDYVTVTTLAGNPGIHGHNDGTGSTAMFNLPIDITITNDGTLFVADSFNHVIRKVTQEGVVTTIAGSPGNPGHNDGTGSNARFISPMGICVDNDGTLFVADSGSHIIREVTQAGEVTTLAGSPGFAGYADGVGSGALFSAPTGICAASDGTLFVSDTDNHVIRKVVTQTGAVTTLAGNPGNPGHNDATGSAAMFDTPTGIDVTDGTLYVADTDNHVIRKVLTQTGVVTTLAGSPGNPGHNDGTGSEARFNYPRGICAADIDTLFIADTHNHVIREVSHLGEVTTLAGSPGIPGHYDGTGSDARFNFPMGICAENSGTLFVTDTYNHVIRTITIPLNIFLRGDADSDNDLEMSDAIYILQYLYLPGGPDPTCKDSADVDDTGIIEMADAIYLLKHLYVPGNPDPPPPGPDNCGPDPTEDELDCEYHPCMD